MKDVAGVAKVAHYKKFKVLADTSLSLDEFESNAEIGNSGPPLQDDLSSWNGFLFSTFDNDPDGCVANRSSPGWWDSFQTIFP